MANPEPTVDEIDLPSADNTNKFPPTSRRNKARPGGRYCYACHAATMRKYRRGNPKRKVRQIVRHFTGD